MPPLISSLIITGCLISSPAQFSDADVETLAVVVALETPEAVNGYWERYLVASAAIQWMWRSRRSLEDALRLGAFAQPVMGWGRSDYVRYVGGVIDWDECWRAAHAALSAYADGYVIRVTHFHSLRSGWMQAPFWAWQPQAI